jgi:hypothetical protein
LSEVAAAGGQLSDEVVEDFVVGVSAGFGAQDGDAGVGCDVPAGVEVVGGVEVEEGEPGEVGLPAVGPVVEGGVHGSAEPVGGE